MAKSKNVVSSPELMMLKRKQLEMLEAESKKRALLPHLHGYPFYKWTRNFFNSRNKLLFLTGANQISKSSSQIRKFIHWATESELWPDLWPGSKPLTFWYLYPSLKVASDEAKLKWIPEFMPRGAMKDDPKYGWKLIKAPNGLYAGFEFNSGVTIIFRAYEQSVENLQTGTVWALGIDEELPIVLWPELQLRVAATDGYISAVFTPTLSQQYWYEVMEEKDGKKIKLPSAHKMTVSLYDCLVYEDGTPSRWTKARIKKIEATLPSREEILRRVHGRFIMDSSLLVYSSFSTEKNVVEPANIPSDWIYFAGLDSGSGGGSNSGMRLRHPAAIVFVAVRPDFQKAIVTDVWLGLPENIEGEDKSTTAADILRQFVKMRTGKTVVAAYYDYSDADMGIIAEREGISVQRAEKRHDIGESLINTLFKNLMLEIQRTKGGLELINELVNLRKGVDKQRAKDHAADALRYALSSVQFDFHNITGGQETPLVKKVYTTAEIYADRRLAQDNENDITELDIEMEELNELYGGY